MATALTRTPWTPAQDQFLRDHYGKDMTIDEIAYAFVVKTPMAIRQHAHDIGVSKHPGRRIAWTQERKSLLRQLYGVIGSAELAERLGCTRKALVQTARKMGIDCASNRVTVVMDALHRDEQKDDHAAVLVAYAKGIITLGQASYVLNLTPEQTDAALKEQLVRGVKVARAAYETRRSA